MDRQRCVTVCNLLHLPCTFLSHYSLYQVSSLRIPPDIQDLLTVQSAKIEKKERKKRKKKKERKKNGGKEWRCTKVYVLLYYKKTKCFGFFANFSTGKIDLIDIQDWLFFV